MSLLSRLLLLVGLALIPALAALVWGALDAGRAREAAARDDALRLARLVAAEQQRVADGARQLLTALGNLRAVRALDQAECQPFFGRILADFPRYAVLATAGLDGQVVCAGQPLARGNSVADRPYFRRALAEGGFVVGGLVQGRASGRSSFHFAQPFTDAEGRVAGIVHASVGLDWLAEQVARVPLPPGATLSIVDREGIILATRPGRILRIGQPVEGTVRGFIGRAAEGVEDGTGVDGVRRIFAYVPPEVSGTHLVTVSFDRDSLLAEATAVQRRGALVLLGTTLLAIALTLLGAGRLVRRPVAGLLAAAERWRAGDLSARVGGAEGGAEGRDLARRSEFARLGAAFDAMAEATQARERALRDGEREFRAIFETAAVGVSQFNLALRRTERVNRRLCELLGRPEPALLGRDPGEHVHPEDAEVLRRGLANLLATGQDVSEHRIVRPDGSTPWLRVFGAVSERVDGVPVRAVVVVQDVTEQRLAQAANARLAAIVTSAANAIVSLSAGDGRIATWNRGAEALFGYSEAEAVGAGIGLLLPPGPEPGATEEARLLLDPPDDTGPEAASASRDREAVLVAKGGERIPVTVTATRMRAPDGRPIGVSVILRDLRERRAVEQRQRLLMGEIDHRARNVMAVVRSLVQLSPKHDPVAFGRAIEGRIAAMARAHGLLARDRWEGASLRDLVEQELGGDAPGALARFDAEGPPAMLRPDAVQPLSMVLHELVTNSTKHGALSRAGGRVALRWQRDGKGLALTWTERGGPAIAAPPARRGFGSRLIEISLRHQLGGGGSFAWEPSGLVVRMRVGAACLAAPGPAEAPPAPPPPPDPAADGLRGLRVLLAEDEALVAIEVAESLAAAGCVVLGPAATPEEGIALLEAAGRVDAAVLDVNLGGRHVGPLAARLVACGVPMLFTTGYGEAPTGHEDAPVLVKPVGPGALLAALRRLGSLAPAG